MSKNPEDAQEGEKIMSIPRTVKVVCFNCGKQYDHNIVTDLYNICEHCKKSSKQSDYTYVSTNGTPTPESVTSKQVGGNHYSSHKIQPWDIVDEYQLDFYEGCALKYLLRSKDPSKRVEDLQKAIHCQRGRVRVKEWPQALQASQRYWKANVPTRRVLCHVSNGSSACHSKRSR